MIGDRGKEFSKPQKANRLARRDAIKRATIRALEAWRGEVEAGTYIAQGSMLQRALPCSDEAAPLVWMLMAGDRDSSWLLMVDRRHAGQKACARKWSAYLRHRRQGVRVLEVETARDAWEQAQAWLGLGSQLAQPPLGPRHAAEALFTARGAD